MRTPKHNTTDRRRRSRERRAPTQHLTTPRRRRSSREPRTPARSSTTPQRHRSSRESTSPQVLEEDTRESENAQLHEEEEGDSDSDEDEDDNLDTPEDNKAQLKEAARALAQGKDAHGTSKYLRKLKRSARWIKRLLGPAASVYEIITYGPYCINSDAKLPALDAFNQEYLDDLDDDAYDKIGNQYRQLFNIIPALRNDLEYFARNTLRMHQFTTLLSDSADAGRRDDTKILKYGIVDLIPFNGTYDHAITSTERSKAGRGWYNVNTARLICPPGAMFDSMAKDPEKFRAEVVEGQRLISASDYMFMMYMEGPDYDEQDVEKGLLRSEFLLKVFRFIFTGRLSAFSKTPGPSTVGRRPIAVAANRKTVTPEMIAWTVVMAYFALSDKESWCLQDGGVDFAELYDEVVAIFGDQQSEWAVETLQWWNLRVWGPSAVKADGRFQKPSQQSAAAQLRAQRAQKTAPQKKAPSRRVATSPLRFPSDPESRRTSPVRRSESGE